VALGVESRQAQLKWKRRLTDAGVGVSGPIDRGYFHSLYFSDPDGQVLEIATRGPGYAIDEPADALGRELVEPPVERLPGGRDEAAIQAATHPEPVPVVTADMALRGLHHVSAITNDLERAHEFYEEALGLRLVKKTLNQDDARTQHWFWARYDGGEVGPHSAMTLFGWPDSSVMARPGTGQTHHIAFRARDEEQQLAWRDHLLGLGLQVSPVMDRQYFRSIYFSSPDGLLHEIATDVPGFALDEEPAELGSALMLPPWLEDKRPAIEERLAPLPSAAR
jgi:glyoxalase family protein